MSIRKYYPMTLVLTLNVILMGRFLLAYQRHGEILFVEYAVCFIMTVILLTVHFVREYRKLKMVALTDAMIKTEMKSIWPAYLVSALGILISIEHISSSIQLHQMLPKLKDLGLVQDNKEADILHTILFHSYLLVFWSIHMVQNLFKHRELKHKKQLMGPPTLPENETHD
ncbi:hypothetical protein [Paenibacillus sp. Marseille-Q4541]|uniref:hypothetical protein n=1 Tax=Paenibacillus sp. Marseille-Q4541 TaxID=2831522 RepID=UPI001BAB76F3|nr:hypothetical protein [Paenibacillus sp. Marseille-Q4541]